MDIVITQRGRAYLALLSFTASLAIIADYRLLVVFSILLSLYVSMKTYVEIAMGLIEDLVVEGSSSYTTEREPLLVKYRIVNRSSHSILLLEYSLEYESTLMLINGVKAGVLTIPGKTTVVLEFEFRARTGLHWIGPFKVVIRDPLGLFKSPELKIGSKLELSIPPAIDPVIVRRLYAFTRSIGLVKTRTPGEGIEFYDIREYRPVDELKRIVWRVYASSGRLAVWEAERESYQGILYVLDACRDMWTGPYNQSIFEQSARVIASIARYAARRGYAQSIIVFNESQVLDSGKLAHGIIGYNRIMNVIANTVISEVNTTLHAKNWNQVLEKLLYMLPKESTFIFIFTRTSSGRIDHLIHLATKLRSLGHQVYVVTPIVTTYDITRDLPQSLHGVYRAKQLLILREDLEGVIKLRQTGVRVISMTPLHVAQKIVQLIESTTPVHSS
jgi:uncharacterized protein (DUF58 family)